MSASPHDETSNEASGEDVDAILAKIRHPKAAAVLRYRVVEGRLQLEVGDQSGVLPRDTSLTLARAILDWKAP